MVHGMQHNVCMGYIGIYREPHILEQSYSSLHQAHESTMKTVIQLALLSPKATKSTFQVLRSSHWSLAHSLLSRVGKNKPSLPICKLMTLLLCSPLGVQNAGTGCSAVWAPGSVSSKRTKGCCCYLLTPTNFLLKVLKRYLSIRDGILSTFWLKAFLSSLVLVIKTRAFNRLNMYLTTEVNPQHHRLLGGKSHLKYFAQTPKMSQLSCL